MSADRPIHRDIMLPADDGRCIAATVYTPAGAPDLALQINPGTAIPRHFYRHFASWLALQGCVVVTFNNRGVGDSANGPMRSDDFLLSDWGRCDHAAASAWLRDHYPETPFAIVAHSFGAGLMGFNPHLGRARAVLAVGSQFGRHPSIPLKHRLRQYFNGRIRSPLTMLVKGYLPIRRLPGVELPLPAGREMARWHGSRHFFCDASGRRLRPHHGDLRVAMRHVILADDEMIPRAQGEALISLYPNAKGGNLLVEPRDYAVDSIGHFGFFRRTAPERLWQDQLAWLRREAGVA